MEDLSKHKILYSPKEGTSGFWGMRDVPEEPYRPKPVMIYSAEWEEYLDRFESCKSNSLEIIEDEWPFLTYAEGGEIYLQSEKGETLLKPGDIFDLPEGYKFKDEYNCSDCPITDCSSTLCPKRVLRLVKTETKDFEWKDYMPLFDKKIEVAVPKPEPEESQAKLWADAKALSDPWKYFEIQRKKQ